MAEKSHIKKIVFTGGPGVGKTSVLQHLKTLNYDVREEVFTRLFQQAQEIGQLNEEFLHSNELLHNLISAQKALEALPCKGELIFLDRSRVDILGFAKNMGITPSEKDQVWLDQNEYDLIFIFQPLPEKFYVQNSIRKQSQKESIEHHSNIYRYYTAFISNQDSKPELIEVPYCEGNFEDSVIKRAEFIMDKIKIPKN